MATPEQSRPPRTGPEPDSLARSVPEPSHDHIGPEPEDNRPGHHPPEEQDQPPLDDFAAKFGIPPQAPSDSASSEPGEVPPESAPPWTGPDVTSPDSVARGPAAADEVDDGEHGEDSKAHAHRLPRPVRTVWVVAVRWGVLPVLGGVRSASEGLERLVRRTI